jgi:hypothetical protein
MPALNRPFKVGGKGEKRKNPSGTGSASMAKSSRVEDGAGAEGGQTARKSSPLRHSPSGETQAPKEPATDVGPIGRKSAPPPPPLESTSAGVVIAKVWGDVYKNI